MDDTPEWTPAWDLRKKQERDNERTKQEVIARAAKLWANFKQSVKKGINVTPEVLEAMLVDFQEALRQLTLQHPEVDLSGYQGMVDVLSADARKKINLLDDKAKGLTEADRIMQVNSITQKLPDGSDGETYGFETTDGMLAVPFVQNAQDADLVGFCMHGSVLVAVYEGKLKPFVKPLGIVKNPSLIILPGLTDLASQLKEKGVEFPEPDWKWN